MIKISIDGQAIKDKYFSFANYARANGLSIQQFNNTRTHMREDNPVLTQLIKDGYVQVKEVQEEKPA